jgi:hypothetical protein
MDKKFTIEHQFQLYLQMVKLDPAQMSAIQLKETKQAFFASAGQMLILLRDDVSALDEEQAIKTLDEMLSEVHNHFMLLTAN